ncbi:MAG: hypothetical protein AB7O26_00115 [Planctomycetaceae bacterium]
MKREKIFYILTALNIVLVLGHWSVAVSDQQPRPEKIVRAEVIELVDKQGQARAQLFLGEDGSGNIRLRDGNGQVRVKIGSSIDGGTGLLLFDDRVEPTVRLATDKKGTSVTLTDRENKQRVITP